jgi:hypothetical protein
MQNMVKYLLIIVMTLFLVGNMVSSAPPITEGYFIEDTPQTTLKKDRDFQYNFFVYNLTDGILITNESVNCIHYISNSEGAVISFENVPYFESDGHWGLTIDKGNFSENGLYYYGTKCNSSTYGGVTTGTWKVNPSGFLFEIQEAIIYSVFILIFFGLIILLAVLATITPGENKQDGEGNVIGIVKLKYLKVLFIALLYPMIILVLNFLNGLAVNLLSLEMFAGITGFLFETMLRLAWVFTIIIITWIVVLVIKDTNLKKQYSKIMNIRI